MPEQHFTGRTWVVFSARTGAIGSIHESDGGYVTKLLDADQYRGPYDSLENATSALTGEAGVNGEVHVRAK